jgi:hypothetical protein
MRVMPLAILLAACSRTEAPESFVQDTSFVWGEDLSSEGLPLRFVMKHAFSVLQTDPSPFGSSQEALAVTSFLLVTWERTGTEVTWDETLCGLRSNEVFGTTTSYPAAFVASVPLYTRTATLDAETTGASFAAGPFIDVIGADLPDPTTSPLPTSAADSTVVDADGDGNPGITVEVDQNLLGSGEVYVAQRLEQTLSGTVTGPDRIEGFVTGVREQVVLGASAGWLETPVEEQPDPDPSHSFFILQGADPATDCGTLMATPDAFF